MAYAGRTRFAQDVYFYQNSEYYLEENLILQNL